MRATFRVHMMRYSHKKDGKSSDFSFIFVLVLTPLVKAVNALTLTCAYEESVKKPVRAFHPFAIQAFNNAFHSFNDFYSLKRF